MPRRRRPGSQRLPILPLSDEVHFPRTELRLEIVQPEYRELVYDLFVARGSESRLGVVLLRPETDGTDSPRVYGGGTVDGTEARLLDLSETDAGCEVVLRGERRFRLEREVEGGRCLAAMVRPVDESEVSELDPEVQTVRRELLGRIDQLSFDLGDHFELDREQMRDLRAGLPFEALVNHLAANLGAAPERKLDLLREPLLERARRLAIILDCRQQVLDVLRPYRWLAANADWN